MQRQPLSWWHILFLVLAVPALLGLMALISEFWTAPTNEPLAPVPEFEFRPLPPKRPAEARARVDAQLFAEANARLDVVAQDLEELKRTKVEAPIEDVLERDCAVEILILQSRIEWLEAQLIVAGGVGVGTTIGDWYALLRPEERPSESEVRLLAEYLHDYPVRLQPDEGLWIVERMRKDDWDDWGPSIDEVLIRYLSPERIRREVTPEALAVLREYWAEEGYFP